MKTALITPYTESSLHTVKIASLYFDQVELQQHTVLQVERQNKSKEVGRENSGVISDIIKFIDKEYLKVIKPLLDEGVVEIIDEPKVSKEYSEIEQQLGTYLRNNDHLILNILKTNDSLKVHTDVQDREIHEHLIGPLSIGSLFYPEAIFQYYSAQFSDAIRLSSKGLPVLSSCPALYRILQDASTMKVARGFQLDSFEDNLVNPRFAFDVLEALMIDVGELEIDDILEARNKLKDELIAFRSEIDRLQFEFEHEFGRDKVIKDGRSIASARLLPKIKDLENKVENGNHRILKNLFSILRKPDPYVPMLGTSFAGLPVELSLLISLGIVSVEMAIDTYKAKKEFNNDSLFYLMKLRQKAKMSKSILPSRRKDIIINDPSSLALLFPWQVTKHEPKDKHNK